MWDFNAVLGMHEKTCPSHITISCSKFQNTIDACNILKVETKGNFSTWAWKGLHSYSESKLDKSF